MQAKCELVLSLGMKYAFIEERNVFGLLEMGTADNPLDPDNLPGRQHFLISRLWLRSLLCNDTKVSRRVSRIVGTGVGAVARYEKF